MAANTPMVSSPNAISTGESASAVRIELTPMPMKKMMIMPARLHLSAIHPAGIAQTPNATNPGVAYGMSAA